MPSPEAKQRKRITPMRLFLVLWILYFCVRHFAVEFLGYITPPTLRPAEAMLWFAGAILLVVTAFRE